MNRRPSSQTEACLEKKPLTLNQPGNSPAKSRARVVLKNSLALGLSTVVGKLFYFSLFVLIGRYLGPSDLGKFTFALSFIAIFAVINDLGLNMMTVRDVSTDRSLTSKYLHNLATLRTILAFLALVLVTLLVMILGYSEKTIKMVLLLAIATFFANISFGIRWIFQVYLKLEYDSVLSIVQNLLCFGLGYLVLRMGWGIYGVGAMQILAWILILFSAGVLISKKFVPIQFEFDFSFWRKLLKNSIPFALMLVFTSLYLNLDTVLLSYFKGDHAVGLYNAANRFVLAGKMIPGFVIPALFPLMSEIFSRSKEDFDRFLEKSLTLMFCLALPLCVGVTFLAERTINLLFGAEFSGSILALRILIWGMFCMYLSIVIGHALTASGYQRINTIICGIGLGISLWLNFSLIHRFSYLGTSLSILATELFVMMAVCLYAQKLLRFDFKRLLTPFAKTIFATLVLSMVLYFTHKLNLLFSIGAGTVSYFAVLFALKGLYGYDFCKLRDLVFARAG